MKYPRLGKFLKEKLFLYVTFEIYSNYVTQWPGTYSQKRDVFNIQFWALKALRQQLSFDDGLMAEGIIAPRGV